MALSKWVLLSCSGMGDNIFNSWIGNYRFGVLAVPNRQHYPIVILLPVSGGDSPSASGSAQRVEASPFTSPLSTTSAPQSHNPMPRFMLWAEPIFLRAGSFISLSICFFHWASLCSCQWFPFVLRQDLCVSQAGHLTCYVAQAGSKSWSSYLSQVLELQVYTIIPVPLNLNSIRERTCVPFPIPCSLHHQT